MLSEIGLPKATNRAARQGFSGYSEKSWFALMPDAELRYSPSKVKRAGKILRGGCASVEQFAEALEVFENWQECHSYPMNQFYDSLSQSAQALSP